jgi:hypothetical protein
MLFFYMEKPVLSEQATGTEMQVTGCAARVALRGPRTRGGSPDSGRVSAWFSLSDRLLGLW